MEYDMKTVLTRNGRPAINIKKHLWSEDVLKALRDCHDDYPDNFANWLAWAVDEPKMWESPNGFLAAAEERARFDMWQSAVDTAFWTLGEHVNLWQEGRSGGWLVADGLGNLEWASVEARDNWDEFRFDIEEMVNSNQLAELFVNHAYSFWEYWCSKIV